MFFGTSGHFLNGYFTRHRVGTLIVDYIINKHIIYSIYNIYIRFKTEIRRSLGGDRKYVITYGSDTYSKTIFFDIYPKFIDAKRPHPEKLATAIVFSKSFPGLGKSLQLAHIPSREPTYPTLEKR